MHSVEIYCLDKMLFYELWKFQVIWNYTFWKILRSRLSWFAAPGSFYLFIFFQHYEQLQKWIWSFSYVFFFLIIFNPHTILITLGINRRKVSFFHLDELTNYFIYLAFYSQLIKSYYFYFVTFHSAVDIFVHFLLCAKSVSVNSSSRIDIYTPCPSLLFIVLSSVQFLGDLKKVGYIILSGVLTFPLDIDSSILPQSDSFRKNEIGFSILCSNFFKSSTLGG